jgi:hypothetical protein
MGCRGAQIWPKAEQAHNWPAQAAGRLNDRPRKAMAQVLANILRDEGKARIIKKCPAVPGVVRCIR